MSISRLARAAKRAIKRIKVSAQHSEDQGQSDLIKNSGLFDPEFYLARYPDVARAGLDPADHYVHHGAKEGRWPNAFFDSAFYLGAYPDITQAGLNPLTHYAAYGWKELRNPSADFDTAWYWLVHMDGRMDSGCPLTHYVRLGRTLGLSVREPEGLSPREKGAIDRSITHLLALPDLPPRLCESIAASLTRFRMWSHAEPVYRRLIGMEWNVASHHAQLAYVLGVQERWWQQIEALNTAIQLNGRICDWHYQLGVACEAMERWEDAARAYRQTLMLAPDRADVDYRLGYVLEKAGHAEARQHYARAIVQSAEKGIPYAGIGRLHENRGDWASAVAAYADATLDKPLNAQMHYRLGLAHARSYQWGAAVQAYRTAIALDRTVAQWHYRLGLALERMEQWDEAAAAYGNALTLNKHANAYWRYRCGYVLIKAGHYQRACEAFITPEEDDETVILPETNASDARLISEAIDKAFARDPARTDLFHALGRKHQMQGDWAQAAAAYRAAADRSDDYQSELYYDLGYALYKQGQFQSACEAFRETRIARGAYGVDSRPFENRPEDLLLLSYRHYLEDLPIRERTLVYESFGGVAPGCNPLAIFRHIADDPEFADWTHIWVVDEHRRIPDTFPRRDNILFVTKGSDLYVRYLASASHLINNSTFPHWFIRREGQKYLNTWHGTPLKTLGKDIKNNFMEHKNTARNFLHATHIISPNAHTTHVLIDRYDLKGLVTAAVAETGYPRNDAIQTASAEAKAALRNRLGLDEDRPVVLYAPTWRGTLGSATLDEDLLRQAISRLSMLPCQLVFRGHYYSEALIAGLNLPICIAPYDADTSELLSITDVLVTDYSSLLFDFLPAQKPIVCFAYDRDDYQNHRGLYFEMDQLPADVSSDVDALEHAVSRAIAGATEPSSAAQWALDTFCPHDDGHATARVVDFFFRDDFRHVVSEQDERKTLLFYAGAFPPNGITTSCLNLLASLDYSRYRAVLVIDPANIEQFSARMDKFAELPPGVQVIARVGPMVADPEERRLIQRAAGPYGFTAPEMWDIFLDAHALEFRRMFGGIRFDAVVQFDGYSRFWTAVFAGSGPDVRKVMYMHNDMVSEAETKFPAMRFVYSMFRHYDSLVSVSDAMRRTNRDKMADPFGIAAEKFVFAENVINHEAIIALSQQPLDPDMAQWLQAGPAFLTMGRMSPEKDQAKLIRAFRTVHDARPDTRLVLLGDGPLRADIEQLVHSLGLRNAVMLAGQRSNPFPALKACDCFVLSSNHEGQPMVLLEAMVLGKPIIATDIDGNRGVLAERDGCLVPNTDTGLAQGMLDFLKQTSPALAFDPIVYRQEALSHFDKAVSAPLSCPAKQERVLQS